MKTSQRLSSPFSLLKILKTLPHIDSGGDFTWKDPGPLNHHFIRNLSDIRSTCFDGTRMRKNYLLVGLSQCTFWGLLL